MIENNDLPNYQQPLSSDVKVAQKVVIIHPKFKDKFLLLVRKSEEASKSYDLPGGNLAPFEKHEESLIREIKEETGLKVTDIMPVIVQSHVKSETKAYFLYIGYVALATDDNVHVNPDEDHDKHMWVTLAEFKKMAGEHIMLRQIDRAFEIFT